MKQNRKLVAFFIPSWIINLVAITCAVVVPSLVIFLSRYQASDLMLQVGNANARGGSSVSELYTSAAGNLASNKLLGNAPLLIIWACAGLGVYVLAISIIKAFSDAVELHEHLEYVNVSRRTLVREAIVQFTVRAAATIGWFAFIKLTISILLPYALALASIASLELTLRSVAYGLLAGLIIYVTACGHAIFLRLIFLRARLFG